MLLSMAQQADRTLVHLFADTHSVSIPEAYAAMCYAKLRDKQTLEDRRIYGLSYLYAMSDDGRNIDHSLALDERVDRIVELGLYKQE